MLPLMMFSMLMAGCEPDHTLLPQRRELSTEFATFDAGAVAVGDRETVPVYLQSTGRGPVTIFDIYTDDEQHFAVLDSWKTDDIDGDGINDAQIIPGGEKLAPSYGLVEINFRPDAADYFRTTLTIVSNDSEVTEQNADGRGLWKVVVRGIGRYPCAYIYPLFRDFGERAPGGYYSESVVVENCGAVTVTISDFDVEGSTSFYVPDSTPIYVLPDTKGSFQVAWIPASQNGENASVTMGINDPSFDGVLEAVGNDCTASVDTVWDVDGDGWSQCGGDCDDESARINPGEPERLANGIDDDCDGEIDENNESSSTDDDSDGYSENQGDCDDTDAAVFPGATEVINQVDDDCDGDIDDETDWFDDDGDNYSEREGDCDDNAPLVHPGAPESVNGADDDCDGIVDEESYTYDDDGDGYPEYIDDVQVDCEDDDPWTFPGAPEDCDGRDNDCDQMIDEDTGGVPRGACAFLVERSINDVVPRNSCSAASAPMALCWGGLFIAATRRRRPRC